MFSIYWRNFQEQIVCCLECGSFDEMVDLKEELRNNLKTIRYYYILNVPE